MQTISETAFIRYCQGNGIHYEVVPCKSDEQERTPDFDIFPGGNRISVEIKELTPNDLDRTLRQQAHANGAAAGFLDPSARIRRKISTGARQLKSRTCATYPSMVVLYDNGTIAGIDSIDLKNAMYGHESVRVSRVTDTEVVIDQRLGGGRTCTSTDNRSLSAVGLLCGATDAPRLLVYHNLYALNPIPKVWLQSLSCQQFMIDVNDHGGIPEWRGL